jgi:hypothetical protein
MARDAESDVFRGTKRAVENEKMAGFAANSFMGDE